MFFFFFNDTATTEIYTLSLHDALPIYLAIVTLGFGEIVPNFFYNADTITNGTRGVNPIAKPPTIDLFGLDRKSTRLNSSHANISYAVFCLKKKQKNYQLFLFLPRLTNI